MLALGAAPPASPASANGGDESSSREVAEALRASGVPCNVSATTVDAVAVGERFGEFETPHGLDAFGERGEFHTLARVWEGPRRAALGV